MANFAKNLKRLRVNQNLTKDDFAKKINITKAAISNYENGRRLPDYETLELIADYFNVNIDFLMGRKFCEKDKLVITRNQYTSKEKDIIKKYRNSDVGVKSVVDTVLDMSEKISSLENSTLKEDTAIYTVYKEIPCYPRLASAGNGQYVFDDVPFETIKVDAIKYRKADYAIQVNGDSMEPTFYDSDTLLVARHELPEKGEVGIFIVDGSGYVKRMGSKELLSDNPDYPSVKGTDGICMGKVLGKL